MSRFKVGDTVRRVGTGPMCTQYPCRRDGYVGVVTSVGADDLHFGSDGDGALRHYELVPVAPTIDPSKWVPYEWVLNDRAERVLAMWCLTNLADEILAYVILPNLPEPEPEMGTITLPWDVIEKRAEGDTRYTNVIMRACREALEAR